MKKIVCHTILMFLSMSFVYGQGGLIIQSGSHLLVSGNAAIVVNDGSFINNGVFSSGSGTLYMKGSASTADSKLKASNTSDFNHVVIDKTANGVQLDNHTNVYGNLDMQNGTLDLNGKTLAFYFDGAILNETEANRIWGNSGTIFKAGFLNMPSNVDLGNMGLQISASQNLSVVYVRRIHGAEMINGVPSVTRRYKVEYFIPGLSMDYSMKYFDAELNGIDEAHLQSWKNNSAWEQHDADAIDTSANLITVNGLTEADTVWAFSTGKLHIAPKVLLQGNYASAGLMTDRLRTASLIPTIEPYTSLGYTHIGGGGEQIDPSVLNISGNDAIVDWVFLELRDKANASSVLATRSALLQKDGDIVDLDGVSSVSFGDLAADDYYLAVRHRNHLGIRSAAVQNISGNALSFDFSSTLTQVYDNPAITTNDAMIDLGGGTYGMIGGNVNGNSNVRATGPPFINDYSTLLNTLGGATNILSNQYSLVDLNMDGTIRATGPPFINDFSKLLSILGASTAILNSHLD